MNPLLKRIADAQASNGGNWIKDGEYKFTVLAVKAEAKNSGSCFIVELFVDEATPISGMFEKAGKPCWADESGAVEVKPNPAGSRCSYVLNLDSSKSAAGNAKAFLLRLLGEEEVTDMEDFLATLEEITGKSNPARGMKIGDATFRKKIKGGDNAGKVFVGHGWQTIEMTSEEIAENRKRFDRADAEANKTA